MEHQSSWSGSPASLHCNRASPLAPAHLVEESSRPPPILHDFLAMLKMIERRNWENKIFYHPVSRIEEWMLKSDPAFGQQRNYILLHECFQDPSVPHDLGANDLTQHYLVFAILVKIGYGDLIHIFKPILSDDHLRGDSSSATDSNLEHLRENKIHDPEHILRLFDQTRWALCHVGITLNMTKVLHDHDILPFRRRDPINEKGGQANVYQFTIEADLIAPDLARVVKSSLFHDESGRQCYKMAVKTFMPTQKHIFYREYNAFKAIQNQPGFINCLGQYKQRSSSEGETSYNLLLEYGEQDLDEFLADRYPPVHTPEIIKFWERFFKVAEALRIFHRLEYSEGVAFNGWHGDIKPDNILIVNGEYKIADFGFATIEPAKGQNAKAIMPGGTDTYGAPEFDYRRRQANTLVPHTQQIDTWSLGCVLSVVATWVVLGSQAYDQYREVRKAAITKLREDDHRPRPTANFCFHDSREALPAVLEWHKYLRNSLRRSDIITRDVLDLIDSSMLASDPMRRLESNELCSKLQDILTLASYKYEQATQANELYSLDPSTMEALWQFNATMGSIAPSAQTPRDSRVTEGRESAIVPSDSTLSQRVTKPLYMQMIPRAKVAYRDEVFKSELMRMGHPSIGMDVHHSPEQIATDSLFPGHPPEVNRLSVGEPLAELDARGEGSEPHADLAHHHQKVDEQAEEGYPQVQGGTWPRRREKGKQPFSNGTPMPTQSFYQKQFNQHDRDQLFDTPRGPTKEYRPQSMADNTHTVPPRQYTYSPNGQTSPGAYRNTVASYPPEDGVPIQPLRTRSPTVDFDDNRFWKTRLGQDRNIMDVEWRNSNNLWNRLRNNIPVARELAEFIRDRDVVFVVDNSSSMRRHWPLVARVAQTLAMKVGPLDDDGIDLHFTFAGDQLNKHKVKGLSIRTTFEQAITKARVAEQGYQTAMSKALSQITTAHLEDLRTLWKQGRTGKKLTIIVLTDGEWVEGDIDKVEQVVVDTLTAITQHELCASQSRPFSIQFVSFAEKEECKTLLKELDDNMTTKHRIPDAIDTENWTGDPLKMIAGSINDEVDQGSPSGARHSMTSFPPTPTPQTKPSRKNTIQKLFSRKES